MSLPDWSLTLNDYISTLKELEKENLKNREYGSMLILAIMEEVGEIARAYLAQHGRKPNNLRALEDESYKQELGDLLASILKLAIYKNIDLDECLAYTLKKIKNRKKKV